MPVPDAVSRIAPSLRYASRRSLSTAYGSNSTGPRCRSYSAGIEPANAASLVVIAPSSLLAASQPRRRIVRPIAECLHPLPECLAARLADLVEIGRLAPDVPRLRMQSARLRQMGRAFGGIGVPAQPYAQSEMRLRERDLRRDPRQVPPRVIGVERMFAGQ